MSEHLKICLILSGSIAAYKSLDLTSRLIKAGYEVQTVATEGALHFVGAASLEGLSGKPVQTDLWARRENMAHINLRRWADLFVFYPATANRINALAAGLASDLVGAIFLANNFEKPFWIAPAMNSGMLAHPATQASLARLRDWGCRIIDGDSGSLACGDIGPGRLAEPQSVFEQIQAWSTQRGTGTKRRLLLTGGAMAEAIDAVRSITNSSTGATACTIAKTFLGAGWTIDFLHHQSVDVPGSLGSPAQLNAESYSGFADFSQSLTKLLQEKAYDAVIHAAAVSDYHVAQVASGAGQTVDPGKPGQGKLDSGAALSLTLAANPKLLPGIRPQAHVGDSGRCLIVGFKLTVNESESQGAARCGSFLDQNQADLVVWNDVAAMQTAGNHPFVVFGKTQAGITPLDRGNSNQELAQALLNKIEQGNQHES